MNVRHCVLCDAPCHAALCSPCHADLPWHHAPQCPVCAWPTPQGEVCGACARRPPQFSRLHAALTYGFPVDRLIHHFKYGGQLHLGHVLADLLADDIRRSPQPGPPPDLLLPVPMHPQRLRERGYNQAVELARLLGQAIKYRVELDAAERTRNTLQQTALPREERIKNMRGAFQVSPSIAGRRVAIIDDVVTTGATVNALALALRSAGAIDVTVWCVARATLGAGGW